MPNPTAIQCSTSATTRFCHEKNQNAATASTWNTTMNPAVTQFTLEIV